jgi:hypothetical protein
MNFGELGPLEMRQVRRTPEEALFNSLLQQHHYLGYSAAGGRASEVSRPCPRATGRLPRVVLGAASSGQPRPLHRLGAASTDCRTSGLLAYNTRFLILPWVTVPHLASHLLGRMARQLSADWQAMYGHPIYFPRDVHRASSGFAASCYRAANWQSLGMTTGRGKDAPTHVANRSLKEVLGYPLVKDFRQRLSAVA